MRRTEFTILPIMGHATASQNRVNNVIEKMVYGEEIEPNGKRRCWLRLATRNEYHFRPISEQSFTSDATEWGCQQISGELLRGTALTPGLPFASYRRGEEGAVVRWMAKRVWIGSRLTANGKVRLEGAWQ